MRSFDKAGPHFTLSRTFAPVRLLRVRALGAELAFDAASVHAVLAVAESHAPVRFGAGLVMAYEGRIVPLVDYRASGSRGTTLAGAALVVAHVHRCRIALAVDSVGERVSVAYAAIRMPGAALAESCPYLAGRIRHEGSDICLVDLERLLGPAIRTHLSACR